MKKALLILLFIATNVFGYTLTPMVESFKSTGKEKSKTFELENSSEDPVSVELEVTTRSIDKNGKELRTGTSDFIVYPMQLTLKGNSKRKIRLSYVGRPDINEEIPYRLLVSQLAVKSSKQESGVKMIFSYVASIYVTTSKVKESNLKIIDQKHNKNIVTLSFKNIGKSHVPYASYELIMSQGTKNISITEKMFQIKPYPNYLPGNMSKASIVIPASYDARKVSFALKKKHN